MPERATWIVQLFVDGPIAVPAPVHFQHPKGFDDRRQFYSEVSVQNSPSGLRMSVTAFARERDLARKAALVFVGEMLDVLATELKLPLRLSLFDPRNADRPGHSVKRVVREIELRQAFGRARVLSEQEPTFLRALSWFRKGLITEDPIDRFLAFWLTLEIVATKYHPDLPEAKKGSKSQIWESFKMLWGDCANWPLICHQDQWIDENYDLRLQIAHGTAAVDVEAVERAAEMGDIICDVSQRFLTDWVHRNCAAYSCA
jgi:hypothetical protein